MAWEETNICMCDTQDGYPHNEYCPYPYFGHVDSEMARWRTIYEALRVHYNAADHDMESFCGCTHPQCLAAQKLYRER